MTFTRNSWLSVWSIVGYVCHVKKSVAICTDDDGYAYGVMRVLCDRRGLPCERLGMPACVLWLPLLPRPCRCSVTLSYGYCHGSGAPEGELLFADLAPPAAPNP